jgi:hypothetical protein
VHDQGNKEPYRLSLSETTLHDVYLSSLDI